MLFEKTSTVEQTMRKLIARVTRDENVVVTANSTFKGLGIDSLEVVNILVNIEDLYGIDLEDADLKNIKDMGSFIKYIEKKVAGKKGPRQF
jgi:acyl carrier protein